MNNKTKKNILFKSASIIIVCTLISKVLGLLRDSVTAAKFGAGSDLDAFFAASNVPMILFITIGAAITTTLIPLYNERLKVGKKEAVEFINNVLNFFIIITLIICVICVILNKPIVSLLNPGFHGDQFKLTQILTIIFIPTLAINAVIYIFNAVLQSENNFVVPALVALPFNVLIIGFLVFYGTRFGVLGLTIVTLVATFIQILPMIRPMYKGGFRYKPFLNLKDPLLRRMGIMLIPVILGTGVQQINSFIERASATNFSPGSLSSLSYAWRVFALIIDIFIVSISTVIYPQMARQSADNKMNEMKVTLSKSINILILIIVPLTIIVIIQSKAIIFILFQRGAFTSSATNITAQVLIFYSLGLLAFGLRDFICKAFYSLKDTKTPMINSVIAMGSNIVLIYVFKALLGLRGLALANAVSTYIACLLLLISLRKKIGGFNGKKILETVIKTSISSVVMVLVILFINNKLAITYTSTISVLLKMIISSFCGLIIFTVVGFISGIVEIKELITQAIKILKFKTLH